MKSLDTRVDLQSSIAIEAARALIQVNGTL